MDVLPAVIPFLWLTVLVTVRVGKPLDWAFWAVVAALLQFAQLMLTALLIQVGMAISSLLGVAATCVVYSSSRREANASSAQRKECLLGSHGMRFVCVVGTFVCVC